jgi:hypothetical protein
MNIFVFLSMVLVLSNIDPMNVRDVEHDLEGLIEGFHV